MWDLSYALAEEIGDPDLFVGREKEMARVMKWAEGTKRLHSKSMGILSRRKKGKTALLQRFFNILYDRNDPQLIPSYYRIPENVHTKSDFTESFYRRTLTQYFAFTTRTPEWARTVLPMDDLKDLAASDRHLAEDIRAMEDMLARAPTSAWPFAQEAAHRISAAKDVRILQILDEFQYMNKYIVSDDDPERIELLCHSYMGAAESKYSPQIVAGSYIGWLETIMGHLTGRYDEWHLGGFSDHEALVAVYNYAYTYQVPITEATAPYIAQVCENDPYYIAATISDQPEEKDLTTEEGVRDALAFETVAGQGRIARVWLEYLHDAFARVNDVNARKIVLYLARHEGEARTRTQIREDLDLSLTDEELEKRMHQLVRADILAYGSSYFHYQGLGDKVFALVFRRLYGTEIEHLDDAAIVADFKRQLATAKGRIAAQKGKLAEHRVRYRLLVAALHDATLDDIVMGGQCQDTPVGPFASIRKAHVFVEHEKNVEIDLHAVHEYDDGTDLMIEVKDWESKPPMDAVRRFVAVKDALEGRLERRTDFLFYSESGLGQEAAATLAEAGVQVLDPAKLAGYEASFEAERCR